MPEQPLPLAAAIDTAEFTVRGTRIALDVGNPRLRIWAENFERTEPEIIDWIDGFGPDEVLYDIGASIGHFALYAALARTVSVVAIEPEAQNYATLERNHFLNGARLTAPFVALNLAASDAAGLGRLYCGRYGAGEHVKVLDVPTNRETLAGFDALHVQSVLKLPLDRLIADFGLPPPTRLKVDVDGSEVATLRGAAGLLAAPALRSVFIELHDDIPSDREAAALLVEAGFREQSRAQVVRLRGGHYAGLYNIVFAR